MESPSKQDLRRALLEQRTLFGGQERASASSSLADRFFSELPSLFDIGAYWAIRGEVPTEGILRRLILEGRRIYLPRISGGSALEFAPIEGEKDLEPGPFGILQPKSTISAVPLGRIPLLVIPGVAFDLRGGRIGWGKGYYDSVLKGYRGRRLALAFDFQVLDRIPTGEHDEAMDAIVTERRAIVCREPGLLDFGRET